MLGSYARPLCVRWLPQASTEACRSTVELTQFRDRNRAAYIHPWGVVEPRAIGIEAGRLETSDHPVPWRSTYDGGGLVARLNIATARGCPGIDFHHPEMQEVLLVARKFGAEVRRGVVATGVRP